MKFGTFHVSYDYGPGTQTVTYAVRAASYPHACAKAAAKHPGCRILGGLHGDESGITRYEGVSTVAVEAESTPEPEPEPEPLDFPFVSECEGKRQCDVVDWKQNHGITIVHTVTTSSH
jgi:hypothetical protein